MRVRLAGGGRAERRAMSFSTIVGQAVANSGLHASQEDVHAGDVLPPPSNRPYSCRLNVAAMR
jgi:hypothetical protein